MTELTSKDFRDLAWDDLANGQYWLYVAGTFILNLITGSVVVVAMMVLFVFALVTGWSEPGTSIEHLSSMILPMFLGSCLLSIPMMYIIGFMTWAQTKMAMAAANRGFDLQLSFSGWGHGWKMCWTVLVEFTYIQLWLLFFIVPGIVKAFSYAMTPFVQVEHPDWTATQCITESCRLMRGNRWRYFYLNFSFIGWFLLCGLANLIPGLGNLAQIFLVPYINTAQAHFYRRIKFERCAIDTQPLN